MTTQRSLVSSFGLPLGTQTPTLMAGFRALPFGFPLNQTKGSSKDSKRSPSISNSPCPRNLFQELGVGAVHGCLCVFSRQPRRRQSFGSVPILTCQITQPGATGGLARCACLAERRLPLARHQGHRGAELPMPGMPGGDHAGHS